MAENEKVKISLRLDEEGAKRFLLIKEYLGLKNDTEVLRWLLTDFWNKYQAKKEEEKMTSYRFQQWGEEKSD